ncbi:unnamed protein product [Amoebophrya sp. A25]|nr:unnamed protein product [Amoebophrya sp. A25]|eukprot:GSA25T00014596001.1
METKQSLPKQDRIMAVRRRGRQPASGTKLFSTIIGSTTVARFFVAPVVLLSRVVVAGDEPSGLFAHSPFGGHNPGPQRLSGHGGSFSEQFVVRGSTAFAPQDSATSGDNSVPDSSAVHAAEATGQTGKLGEKMTVPPASFPTDQRSKGHQADGESASATGTTEDGSGSGGFYAPSNKKSNGAPLPNLSQGRSHHLNHDSVDVPSSTTTAPRSFFASVQQYVDSAHPTLFRGLVVLAGVALLLVVLVLVEKCCSRRSEDVRGISVSGETATLTTRLTAPVDEDLQSAE